MEKYNNRNEVPEKYKWDLTDFFKNEEEFNNSLEETKKLIDKLNNYKGCTKDPKKMYEFLTYQIDAISKWEDLYVYSYLISDQELGNEKSIERKNKTIILNTSLELNTSFFAPELLKLDNEEYNNLFVTEPKLLEFKEDLDMVYRDKEHILSENEEMIVSELNNSSNHYADLSSTLLNSEHNYGSVKLSSGKTEEIATTNYRLLLKDKNPKIREEIYNSFNKVLSQYGATSAGLLNSFVSLNNSNAKIRKFNSSWEAKLFGLNLNDNVFKTLVSTVEDNLSSLQRYYKLRKRILNLPVLHTYDNSLELSESNKEYSIDDAVKLIHEALIPLGSEYLKKFDKIIDNRYIDYCQYKGKCSGGYSFSTMTKDSRILMSYNGELTSVSTIAHEAGHNVHHQCVKENNPLQYRNPSSLVCEVASLTNECLLSNYIVNNSKDKNEKLAGLNNIIDVIISNLFGAVREGKIEQDMYDKVLNGGTLTKEYMNKLVIDSLSKYYGDTVELDQYSGNGWITRSHYYMNFYLYSYAICISVASNVASKILDGDKEMLTKYLQFLNTGSDKWPVDAFKILGIDLEDKSVYENAIKYFDSLITKYYEILEVEEVE